MLKINLVFQGVTRIRIQKIGLKCADWAQLFFEDVRVPVGNILGKEGDGFKQLMVQVTSLINHIRTIDGMVSTMSTYSFKTNDCRFHFTY